MPEQFENIQYSEQNYFQDPNIDQNYQEPIENSSSVKKFILRIFFIVIIFSLLAAYLTQHIYVMKISYETQALEKELKKIKEENELLQIKLAKYESLEWIDEQAQSRLGMIRPQRLEYIIMRTVDGH